MIRWNNLDTLESWKALADKAEKVDLKQALAGEAGAERVKKYAVPMGGGLTYYYGAKQVNEGILQGLASLAEEAQLSEKYQALYEGAVINTGEKPVIFCFPSWYRMIKPYSQQWACSHLHCFVLENWLAPGTLMSKLSPR